MKFRKRPVVIEAFQVHADDGLTRQLPPMWLISAIACRPPTVLPVDGGGLDIKTLEGTMRADVGDWIIQGVKGELYPCKPDIFAATYEPASEPSAEAAAQKRDATATGGITPEVPGDTTQAQDAARYRWLRQEIDHGPIALCEFEYEGWSPISSYCDEYVDRAMAQGRSEGAR